MLNSFKYFQIYIIYKKSEIFWYRDVIDIREIKHFEFVLNDLKYIFWDICPKKIRQEKKFELCQNDLYSQRFLNYIKCQND